MDVLNKCVLAAAIRVESWDATAMTCTGKLPGDYRVSIGDAVDEVCLDEAENMIVHTLLTCAWDKIMALIGGDDASKIQ
jgi:hypothetical protein